VQYAPGYNNGDNAGDPMMIVVPPVEQFGTVFAASTVVHGSWRHYVNVVAPTASLAKLSIDGAVVDATLFARLPDSDLSVGAVEVASGHHVFASESPFGLYSYGIGLDDKAYDAYGHGGGQLYNDLRQAPKGDGGMESAPDIGALIHRR
jgi:hypothetical protein